MTATLDSPAGDPPEAAQISCTNCGQPCPDKFCGHCGQKQPRPGDLGLKHALSFAAEETFNVDGKVFHSLKLLLSRPGQLTLDFIEGRRARHVHPVRLTLVFIFLFFLFGAVNPLLQLGPAISGQMVKNPKLMQTLETAAARKNVTVPAVIEGVNQRMKSIGKPLDFFAIALNCLVIWLFFGRRRYLTEHLTMGLHLACFNIAASLLIGWLRLVPSLAGAAQLLVIATTSVYFVLAARRVYGEGWTSLVLKYLAIQIVQILVMVPIVVVAYIAFLGQALR